MERKEFLKYIKKSLILTMLPVRGIFKEIPHESLEDRLFQVYKEVEKKFQLDNKNIIAIDGKNQRMYLINKEKDFQIKAEYGVSTGKYGFGNKPKSGKTPTGIHKIREKYSNPKPPLTERVMVLEGCEEENKSSYSRRIYIHGTLREELIGIPCSKGCIRMKNKDIIELYGKVEIGTYISIKEKMD